MPETETTPATEPIRVLIAKPGLDGHDVGARVVCRALAEAGMAVSYTGLRQSPAEIADAAIEKRAQVIGLSVLSGAHLPLCEKMADEMKRRGMTGVVWIVGGNIPRRDFAALKALGVAGIFPVGTPFDQIVNFIREQVTT